MHKNDLIQRVANDAGVAQSVVARVLNQTFDLITDEVAAGRKVVLTGFGTFEQRTRRERRGVHPRTAAPITVPATRTPGFTAGSAFKEKVQTRGEGASAKPGPATD